MNFLLKESLCTRLLKLNKKCSFVIQYIIFKSTRMPVVSLSFFEDSLSLSPSHFYYLLSLSLWLLILFLPFVPLYFPLFSLMLLISFCYPCSTLFFPPLSLSFCPFFLAFISSPPISYINNLSFFFAVCLCHLRFLFSYLFSFSLSFLLSLFLVSPIS